MPPVPTRLTRLLLGALLPLLLAAAPARAGDTVVPTWIRVLLEAPDRSADDRAMDARRHPAELLAFTGVQPGMRVLDLGAGRGYTAELLARAVGPGGQVLAQTDTIIMENFLKTVPARYATPVMKQVTHVVRPSDDPVPAGSGPFDLITALYIYHDTVWMGRDRVAMNQALFRALKPGGTLVVVDHAGNPGTGSTQTRTLHRIEPGVVLAELEAAGFRRELEGHFLDNPLDPRDTPYFKATVPVDGFAYRLRRP